MAGIYTDWKNAAWDRTAGAHGGTEVLTAPLALILVSADYAPNFDTDFVIADIGVGMSERATPTGITVVNAILSFAGPLTFPAVPPGPEIIAAVLAHDTGDDTTSPLIAYLDQWDAGFPFTPDTRDIEVNPNAGGLIQL